MTWWVAGAVVVSGAIGANAASKAAKTQGAAANAATAEQARQYDQLREDQTPYRQAGYDALEQLRAIVGYDPTPDASSVMAEPGYQFGLQQGRDAVQGSAAARGGLYSGQALKELMQYGNDYATTKYGQAWDRSQQGFGNRWNRLASLAGLGQTSVQQTGAAGQNYANQVGGLMTGAANAQAAAGLQRASIWGNGVNQLAGLAAWQRQPTWQQQTFGPTWQQQGGPMDTGSYGEYGNMGGP